MHSNKYKIQSVAKNIIISPNLFYLSLVIKLLEKYPDLLHQVQNYIDRNKKVGEFINDGVSQCAGVYDVSGYTRADGTKVDGYIRRCGAKHLK